MYTNNERIKFTRRTFLAGALGGAAGLMTPYVARIAAAEEDNEVEPLRVALVGVGGYAVAAHFMPSLHLYDNLEVTALCDVDERKVEAGFETWRERAQELAESDDEGQRRHAERYERLLQDKPPLYTDYRKMLEEEGDRFDAAVIATPDHSHAVISAAAIRAGKHVFCEKPLTLTVEEARALRELAREHGVVTSLGTQGTQTPAFRRGVELIRQGAIGPVEDVHIWFVRGGANHQTPPQNGHEIPEELAWNLWLGPVEYREYHPRWIARTEWRDTSAGQLGNFGPHTANLPFMGLNIRSLWDEATDNRIQVEAECSEVNHLSFPEWEKIRWRVPARGDMPPVNVHWHHGPELPSDSRETLDNLMRDYGASSEQIDEALDFAGVLIAGAEGAILSNSHNTSLTLLPSDRFADTPQDQPTELPTSPGHYHEWVNACRGGPQPLANFDYAAPFNEFLMLGDVATRFPGETLEYDPATGRIPNHDAAHDALGYEYRDSWSLYG